VEPEKEKPVKKQIKPITKFILIICIALIAGLLIGTAFLVHHINQVNTEIKLHMENSVKNINSSFSSIKEKAKKAVMFYETIKRAEDLAENQDYETAILFYENAKQAAAELSFSGGISYADEGIAEMQNRIIEAKRAEASDLFMQGNRNINNGEYTQALEYYIDALEIYLEINDEHGISNTLERIEFTKEKISESEDNQLTDIDGDQAGQDEDSSSGTLSDEAMSNYEHNINIEFDLQKLIDNQKIRPANQIKMGSTEGMNEGWYNGCGWIATYNALLILGKPIHPAEIVKHFEENAGTVFGGVFGTYPNAIDAYIKSFGYNTTHTVFPQISLNIDETIKASKVAILAYLHTSAAHYVTIEYREDIDKFVVYNDGSARVYSENTGSREETETGAAIDSVNSFINNTSGILFSFSLIVVS